MLIGDEVIVTDLGEGTLTKKLGPYSGKQPYYLYEVALHSNGQTVTVGPYELRKLVRSDKK